MSLLKQDTIWKGRVNKSLELELELNIWKNIEYKVKEIKNSAIFTTKAAGHLSELYYLLF